MNVRPYLNKWVILGAILLAWLLTLITAISIGLTSAPQTSGSWVCPRRPDRDPRPNRHLRRAADTDH